MVREALRLRRIDARLRSLQREYYASPRTRLPELFGQYTGLLAEARETRRALGARLAGLLKRPRDVAPGRRPIGVHLGCGDHRIAGWVNVDLTFQGDLRVDVTRPLPFRSEAVDFVHTEDLLEHVELEEGKRLLAECFRVLRPGGVLRVLTPDLESLVARVYIGRETRHLAWCETHLGARGRCEAFNMHLRMEGGAHRFVYDLELLSQVLRKTGFSVRRVRYNRSRHPELRYLDLRDFGLNLFVEATRPAAR
jgi:predicted SAM-dependent methyltransferase